MTFNDFSSCITLYNCRIIKTVRKSKPIFKIKMKPSAWVSQELWTIKNVLFMQLLVYGKKRGYGKSIQVSGIYDHEAHTHGEVWLNTKTESLMEHIF